MDEKYEKIYKQYRSELEHEDNLINNRVSWFLVAQTLLFAALAISLENNKIALGVIVISVGFFSSVFILISVCAAIIAFFRWRNRLTRMKPEGTSEDEYPQLNRSSSIMKFGFVAPVGLPVLFSMAWLFLACIYIPK